MARIYEQPPATDGELVNFGQWLAEGCSLPSNQNGAFMRLLVVGSLPDGGASASHEDVYRKACYDLGAAVAQRGWSISVGTDRTDTADALVVEGARKANRPAEIFVHYHDNEPMPFPGSGSKRSALKFKHVHGPGTWISGRIEEIQTSDVVLLLGGGDKTAQAFHTARALQKACLPVPGFSGASGELWNLFVAATSHLPLKPDELRSSIEPWQGNASATALLGFVEKYVALKPYSARKKSYLALVLIILICAVTTWGGLFFGESTAGRFTLFAVLISSAVMGTALHWFLHLLTQSETQASAELFWARLGAAVIEAFGLFLLLLVGAISVDGNVSFLDHLSNANNFMRVAAIVSIFGLAAGFMTETVSKSLATRFGKFVDGPDGAGLARDS